MRGFTLFEMMLTIFIVAIMVIFSSPYFDWFLNNSNLRSVQMDLVSDLTLLRNESVKRGMLGVFCRNYSCTPSAFKKDGWIVFLDDNNDKQFSPENGDILLSMHDTLKYTITLSIDESEKIIYKPDGTIMDVSSRNLILCNKNSNGRAIYIKMIGRISPVKKIECI